MSVACALGPHAVDPGWGAVAPLPVPVVAPVQTVCAAACPGIAIMAASASGAAAERSVNNLMA